MITLRQYRRMKEKSQQYMADLLGIHVQTYRKIENNPSIATINQAKVISKELMIDYDEIFFAGISSLNGECADVG